MWYTALVSLLLFIQSTSITQHIDHLTSPNTPLLKLSNPSDHSPKQTNGTFTHQIFDKYDIQYPIPQLYIYKYNHLMNEKRRHFKTRKTTNPPPTMKTTLPLKSFSPTLGPKPFFGRHYWLVVPSRLSSNIPLIF
jgi:hypothetical protein